MTAYGRASSVVSFGHLTVEIQSVNRRHLEMLFFLPKELSHFEVELRRWVGERVGRGQVTVRVEATFDRETALVAKANLSLAKGIKEAWEEIARTIDIALPPASLYEALMAQPNLIHFETDCGSDENHLLALRDVMSKAMEAFLSLRRQEGAALMADLLMRLELLREGIDRIAQRAGKGTERYRQRLMAKMQELLPGIVESDERLLKEICLYAERVDIVEEITRFRSHLQQFEETMRSGKTSVGKTLDFLLQELLREVNTIGSKAMDSEMSADVVGIKAELERVREQLQNVE